jgi:thiol-disulfide isomerase/thioredoxin
MQMQVKISLFFIWLFSTTLAVAAPPLGYKMNEVKGAPKVLQFTLPDIGGEQHSFSDFAGQVVLVNFWATWCPPCVREMPSMERLHQKYKNKEFKVIAINQWENEDIVFEFTGRLSIEPTFLILLDRESRISEAFKVKGLPSTYLIDKKGYIRYKAIGGREFDHPEVENLINKLLSE